MKKPKIKIDAKAWLEATSSLKTQDKKLINAAKKVMKGIDEHFDPKMKHGWDLDYHSLVNEVFFQAYGHNLENYLLVELFKKECYTINTDKKFALVISKIKNKGRSKNVVNKKSK